MRYNLLAVSKSTTIERPCIIHPHEKSLDRKEGPCILWLFTDDCPSEVLKRTDPGRVI